jgi:hypothetical protein
METIKENREEMQTTRIRVQIVYQLRNTFMRDYKGYLASVPNITEVGDYIVVFAGGNVPYLLRLTKDYYRFVGPCYVHGIMIGEAFPENLDELKFFSIC